MRNRNEFLVAGFFFFRLFQETDMDCFHFVEDYIFPLFLILWLINVNWCDIVGDPI